MAKLPSIFLAAALSFSACGSSNDDENKDEDQVVADAAASVIDARPGAPDAMATNASIPGWQLEDVNPMSSSFGQTLGLDEYAGEVIVAILVDSF